MMSGRFILDRWWKAVAESAGLPREGESSTGSQTSMFSGVAKYAKFGFINIPKYLLIDAAWGGFAEGLGLREPQKLIWPGDRIGKSSISEKGNESDSSHCYSSNSSAHSQCDPLKNVKLNFPRPISATQPVILFTNMRHCLHLRGEIYSHIEAVTWISSRRY